VTRAEETRAAVLRRHLAAGCAALLLAACTVQPDPSAPRAASAAGKTSGELRVAPGGLIEARSGLVIDFGRTEESTVPAVTRLLGAAPSSVLVNTECGAGPVKIARWADAGLELVFQRGDFRGWVSKGQTVPTAGGIGVGDDRRGVIAAGGGIRPTNLGDAFTLGGISGLMDTKGRVTTLWAGTTCVFG
jgi:hypothetical protein